MKLLRPQIALVLMFGLPFAAARPESFNEYEVKAAFLYNFARFVDWPADAFHSPRDPMRICILGEDPFGGTLRDLLNGKSLGGRAFAVSDISDSEASGCQILFVAGSERRRVKSILGLKRPATLTVGETEGFCGEGGVVNFKVEGGRLNFEINVDAAAQANLRVSAKVLSLAQIVKSKHM